MHQIQILPSRKKIEGTCNSKYNCKLHISKEKCTLLTCFNTLRVLLKLGTLEKLTENSIKNSHFTILLLLLHYIIFYQEIASDTHFVYPHKQHKHHTVYLKMWSIGSGI